MMPGAGLYLPDTLSKSHDRTETHTARQEYIDHKSSQDSDSDRKSSALSTMSLETVTKIWSSPPTAFHFANWVSTNGKISSDNEVFIDLLQRVQNDVTEASRLYTSQAVKDYLESWPDKKAYIDKIIHDIEKVLNEIGQVVEAVRVSGDDGGTVGLRRKFQWALSHQKKFTSKQQLLMTCHQSLMTAVQLMQNAEMNATFDPIHELPTQAWVAGATSDALKSPSSRQRWRLNQRNSSMPSITVSEPDLKDDKMGTRTSTQCSLTADAPSVRPYQHALAELPGSTPDDLYRPSPDLHAEPPNKRGRPMEEVLQISAAQDNSQSDSRNEVDDLSARPTTADASIAPTPRRRPPDPSFIRRSVDHVRPSLSFFDDRARASFDSARPRAYSEQMRTQRSFEMKSRPSYDQARHLPTVAERPIERFNSTSSVALGDAISIPLSSMRYRSRPVNVRKPPTKHKSLPSTLPYFRSQTSLMEDLSTWINPQSACESYRSVQSIDTVPSIADITPATSVTSSPIIPNSPPTCPPILPEATTVAEGPIHDEARKLSLKSASIESSPVLSPIPVLPSRPAPVPPVSIPPLQIAPQISLQRPFQREDTSESISYESLQRMPSDPIPPPFVRRRRLVATTRDRKSQEETSKEVLTSDASLTPHAPTDRPQSAPTSEKAENLEGRLQERLPSGDVRSSTDYQSALELKQSIHHAASNATVTDKYPMAVSSINPLPVPALPPQYHATSVDIILPRATQSGVHHAPSNASARDKYPILISLDNPSPIPLSSTQSLPTITDSAPPARPQTEVRHTQSSASATDKHPIFVSPTTIPPVPSLPIQSPPSNASSSETLKSEISPTPSAARPMTALAKRRLAHAKRMQMAFGTESETM